VQNEQNLSRISHDNYINHKTIFKTYVDKKHAVYYVTS